MAMNIPKTDKKRVVIVGGGFAGLTLALKVVKMNYQVVLIDKNNYHQFQPLFYQVAMSGLEPSSIVFPLRKLFQKKENTYIRVAEVLAVEAERNTIHTSLGELEYDYLMLAIGAETNFFGNEKMASLAIPMKSVSEALYLRNRILNDYEKAVTELDYEKRQGHLDIVVVGGGPTGVEVSGSLAEMRKYILPKDYPELNHSELDIYLVEGGAELLGGMSEQSSKKAQQFLEDLGVKIKLRTLVTDFDGEWVHMNDGSSIRADKVIWAAGVRGSKIDGFTKEMMGPGNRVKVNRYNQLDSFPNIFAIGDIAFMTDDKYPRGHPQVAQVAIQQANTLYKNLKHLKKNQPMDAFSYHDKGSMATVGRNLAVVDLPFIRFQGAFAWFVWMFVHLFTLLGVKNRVFVFLNWVWNYFTYDQSLRLIIRPREVREAKIPETVG